MPRRPIDPATVARVVELLARHSYREVARQVGVSYQTVSRIANGRYLAPHVSTSRLAPGERRIAPPEDCSLCGARNRIVPCRTCAARDERRRAADAHRDRTMDPRRDPRRPSDAPDRGHPGQPLRETLALDLHDDDRRRLDAIRSRRTLGM